MNFKLLSLSLFSVAAASSFLPAFSQRADATCVLNDVNIQVTVRDRNSSANQVNNTNQQAADDCFGNTVTSTGTQVFTGSGNVDQIRNSNQFAGGGNNPTGVKTPIIKVNPSIQVDVPALPSRK
jgi:predicted ATP-grasp superfamily ATP-dependent carboligase